MEEPKYHVGYSFSCDTSAPLRAADGSAGRASGLDKSPVLGDGNWGGLGRYDQTWARIEKVELVVRVGGGIASMSWQDRPWIGATPRQGLGLCQVLAMAVLWC